MLWLRVEFFDLIVPFLGIYCFSLPVIENEVKVNDPFVDHAV